MEQRRFPRIPFREPSGVETERFESFEGTAACDLSSGGMRLRSHQFLALGFPLRVRFQLQNNQEFIMPGKVVWIQKEPYGDYYQFGVEFENEPSCVFQRRMLESCIEERF